MKTQYSEAIKAIQAWVTEQKLKSGERLPSTQDMVEKIGFNKSTITRAYLALESAGYVYRDGYKLILREGPTDRTSIDGTVYIISYGNERILKHCESFLNTQGVASCGVLFSPINSNNLIPHLYKIFKKKPAGVILWLPEWIKALRPLLESETTPIVLIADGIPMDLNLTWCGTDLYRGVEKALRYLFDRGHRQIAHLVFHKNRTFEHEIVDCYRAICLQLGLKQSSKNIWIPRTHDPEIVEQTFLEHRKKHPEVTALLGVIWGITRISSKLKSEDLTVVSLYKTSAHSEINLTPSGPAIDYNVSIAQWACNEIISDIKNNQSGLPKLPFRQANFIPDFQFFDPKTQNQSSPKKQGTPIRSHQIPAWESWRKTYVFLEKTTPEWHLIDLSKLANHNMTQKHSWLGADPLLYFSPGLRSVHEIPFQVIDAKNNDGASVVTFRSPKTHSTQKKPLPINVKLLVNKRIKALYFLHACGWVKWQEPFAEYRIHFKKRTPITIPLIPIGLPRSTSNQRSGRLKPNIQDWWRTDDAQDFPHAMYAKVYNPALPLEYERLLYTLEWINPHPASEIDFIEIQVDPKAGPALALIAVTALL